MAYFSFKHLISPINSRVPEPENTVNRIQTSGPAESSQDGYHSPSYKSSQVLRDNGKAFGLRPMSPLHKYDRPLKRGALTDGGNPCGQSNRCANPSQSPQQLQSNLAFAKDASGFMPLDSNELLLPRLSNRSPTERWEPRSSPDLSSSLGSKHSHPGVSVHTDSGTHDIDDDDISVMMKGASDLKNTRLQLEDQRRRVAALESQLGAAKAANDELHQKVQAVKDAAKEGYQRSSAILEGFGESLKAIKVQSQEWSKFVDEVQSSIPDIQDIRDTVLEATTGIAPLLAENGTAAQTRSLIHELKSECSNSRQVTDMLRERLTSLSSELVDARCRITDLESMQFHDKEAHRQTTKSLSLANQTIVELSGSIKEQRRELSDAISSAIQLEAKLVTVNERNEEFVGTLQQKENALLELPQLRERTHRLESQVADAVKQTAEVPELRSELANLSKCLQNSEVEATAFKSRLTGKEEQLNDLKAALSKIESQLEQAHQRIAGLQDELRAIGIREERALHINAQIVFEKNTLENHNADLQNKFNGAKVELKQFRETVQNVKAEFQMLQERFDVQSVTLRITKEANGDLQERMLAAETSHARDNEALKVQYNCDVASLKEQRTNLQNQVERHVLQLERQEKNSRLVKVELEKRLADLETDKRDRTHLEEERNLEAKAELRKRDESVEELKQEIARKQEELMSKELEITKAERRVAQMGEEMTRNELEIQMLKKDLATATIQGDDRHEEVEELGKEVEALRAERDQLKSRSNEISMRYAKGDLNDDEKTFIAKLVETSQSVHERELVSKGNEIRRHNNTIQSLQERIKILENAVTRHMKTSNIPKGQTAPQESSMIDTSGWASSQNSSPPTNAPDRDAPSMNEDLAPVAKPITPLHALPLWGKSDKDNPLHPPNRDAIATSIKTRKNSVNAVVNGSSKTNGISFTRLATNKSDEMADFDEEAICAKSALGKRNRHPRLIDESEKDIDTVERADGEVNEIGRPNRKQKISIKKEAAPLKEIGPSKVKDAGLKPRARRLR